MTLEELEQVVADMQSVTPVVEELLFSVGIQMWNGIQDLPSATRFTLMVAPFAMRPLSVDLSFEYWNLASSSTNYWVVDLEKGTGPAGFPNIATRNTQNSGAGANGPIVARSSWNFDAADWDDADMAKGELLCMTWSKVGAPAAIHLPCIATVRYRPL